MFLSTIRDFLNPKQLILYSCPNPSLWELKSDWTHILKCMYLQIYRIVYSLSMFSFSTTNVGKWWVLCFFKWCLNQFLFFFFITDDLFLLEFSASVSLGKLIDYVCDVCTVLTKLIWWVWLQLMLSRNRQTLHIGYGYHSSSYSGVRQAVPESFL